MNLLAWGLRERRIVILGLGKGHKVKQLQGLCLSRDEQQSSKAKLYSDLTAFKKWSLLSTEKVILSGFWIFNFIKKTLRKFRAKRRYRQTEWTAFSSKRNSILYYRTAKRSKISKINFGPWPTRSTLPKICQNEALLGSSKEAYKWFSPIYLL